MTRTAGTVYDWKEDTDMKTALNSSGDVIFTATAEYRHWMKNGKSLPTFLGGETKVDI